MLSDIEDKDLVEKILEIGSDLKINGFSYEVESAGLDDYDEDGNSLDIHIFTVTEIQSGYEYSIECHELFYYEDGYQLMADFKAMWYDDETTI